MLNKIRLLLLAAVLGIGGLAAYNFLTRYEGAGTPLRMKITDKGVDVEIENFRVEHQVLGRKDWELSADFAQIDNERQTTRLKNVRATLNMGPNQQSTFRADAGIMNNKTQDIELQGHVKFVLSPQGLEQHLASRTPEDAPTP